MVHFLILWITYPQYCNIKKCMYIGLDKGGYPVNIFLISPQKHMLWVLIRSASPHHMFLWRNKKNINTFGLKKAP